MRVLVLTRSTGEGHNHAAKAIAQAFANDGHSCDLMDALHVYEEGRDLLGDDGAPARPRRAGRRHPRRFPAPPGTGSGGESPASPSAGAGADPSTALEPVGPAPTGAKPRRRAADIASQLYGWAAFKFPPLFGASYALGDIWSRTRVPSPVWLQNQRYAAATDAYIHQHGYDIVVATHTFPQLTCSAIRARYPSTIKFYGILTDYTCSPFWSEGKIDGYFIPHPDMADECRRQHLDMNRTYALGLPVADAFQHPIDRATARAELGLPGDAPVFLLMSGGVGSMKTRELCDILLTQSTEDTRVIVLTGRREDLFTKIARRYRVDRRVSVVHFTNRVATYMAAADVLLTKPGAVSITEAAVIGLPMVLTGAIPGGETKNSRFFLQRGMATSAQTVNEAAMVAHRLLVDQAARQTMRQCQKTNMEPDAAERIVHRIEDLAL